MKSLEEYRLDNSDRSGGAKKGGGLSIYYKKSLNAHPWKPEVIDTYKYVENERQWLLIEGEGGQKMAFLHCYIACQSYVSNDFLRWNRDLFQMMTIEALQLREEGYIILAMGDFNSHVGQIHGLEGNKPQVNDNEPMFTGFIEEVNLSIINTLPL